MSRPKIFLNVGTYLPGYRGGGPTQSVKNLVEALTDEFEFYIFTANHDLGISEAYDSVDTDNWNKYNGVNIFYSSDQYRDQNLKKILNEQNFSLIFLNSFFSTETIRISFLRKWFNLTTPIVLMPRGELSQGALNIKKIKKMSYLKIAKKIGLLDDVHYLTTADDEYEQVQKLLKTNRVNKVSNIPNTEKKITLNTKVNGSLTVVFLSRITQKKNLEYALETFKNCRGNIIFDIYGTIEEEVYWRKCEEIIATLPDNIIVNYKGELPNERVISTLSKYDLFYFPTRSENYGHVISEALQASIPVLISDQTPWKNLEKSSLGWEYSLPQPEKYAQRINNLVNLDTVQHNKIKQTIYNNFTVSDKVVKISKNYTSVIKNILNKNDRY